MRRVDWVVAAAVSVQLGHAVILGREPGGADLDAVGVILILAQTLPLMWRRRRPLLVAGWCGLMLALQGVGEHPDALPIGSLVAFGTLVRTSTPGVVAAFAGLTLAGAVASAVLAGDSGAADFFLALVLVCLAWTAGQHQRVRDAYLHELEATAERFHRDRQADAKRAVMAERARIARELHDIVSHHVSMMVVQSEAAAATVSAGRGDDSVARLDQIANSGRHALVELRLLLGVLRDDATMPLAPQPGLAELDELAVSMWQAGLEVRLQRYGELPAMPAGLELCVFRIVQESLTNVARHAAATSATVALRAVATSTLVIEVIDDGRGSVGSSNGSTGFGLFGIRERVALYGGSLEAGPRPTGGFVVRATLPLSSTVDDGEAP